MSRVAPGDRVEVLWRDAFHTSYEEEHAKFESRTVGVYMGERNGFVAVALTEHTDDKESIGFRDIIHIPSRVVKSIRRLR